MDIEITSDSEEHFLRSTQWDPDEWILAGKTYHDVPRVVDIARRDLLKIPAHFAPKLPSKSMSISRLLRYDLPPRSDRVECMDIDSNLFTTQKPTADIEDTLPLRLAQAMHAIVKRDYQQGSSAGLNRSTRWKTDSSALPIVKTGNAANAVVTAAGRANEPWHGPANSYLSSTFYSNLFPSTEVQAASSVIVSPTDTT
ncbi:hypothetical protein B0H17DRAFT_1260317, partial [Mycena rosella]